MGRVVHAMYRRVGGSGGGGGGGNVEQRNPQLKKQKHRAEF
jgi:hypothetical protein